MRIIKQKKIITMVVIAATCVGTLNGCSSSSINKVDNTKTHFNMNSESNVSKDNGTTNVTKTYTSVAAEESYSLEGDFISKYGTKDGLLHIKFMDVGNADCSFIELPNGETVLIDTGDGSDTKSIIDYLNARIAASSGGRKKIDYVVLTHSHSDHIGGAVEIFDAFDVGKVYLPDIALMKDWGSLIPDTEENKESINMVNYDLNVYIELTNYCKENNITINNTVRGEYIDSNNILQFVQLDKDYGPVGPDEYLAEYWGMNDNSAVVLLNYGEFRALFCADLSWLSEWDLYSNDVLKGNPVDLLKVSHHGLKTSSVSTFVWYTGATHGVISRAADRVEVTEAVERLEELNVKLYESSASSGVDVFANGKTWQIYE